MARSRRLPFSKDKNGKKDYWKRIRRVTRQAVGSGKEELPHPKELINDWDYCDWIMDARDYDNKKWIEKLSRK
jgi:hypothetical protein